MKLLYQTHSPYARKVLVLAHEAGLADRLDVVHHETSPTLRNPEVAATNPLGKVPVLVLEDGFALFDSTVICEYLDALHDGPKFVPPSGRKRFSTLRLQALSQGICEAGIAVRHETERRPQAYRYPAMRDGQTEKLVAAYDYLERDGIAAWLAEGPSAPTDLGQIALATALSWIEFRGLPEFEPNRPLLSGWYRQFAGRPSMLATQLAGETHD